MFAATPTAMDSLFLLILCRTQRASLPSELLLKLPVSFSLFSYLVFVRRGLLSAAYLLVTINSARHGTSHNSVIEANGWSN